MIHCGRLHLLLSVTGGIICFGTWMCLGASGLRPAGFEVVARFNGTEKARRLPPYSETCGSSIRPLLNIICKSLQLSLL